MSKSIFYRYNPATGRYERVYPTARQRILGTLYRYLGGIVMGLIVVAVAYAFIDFPREKELRAQKERLAAEMEVLNHRSDMAMGVIEDLYARDRNFYRVLLESEPPDTSRADRTFQFDNAYDSISSMTDKALLQSVDRKLTRLENAIIARSESYDYLRSQIGTLRTRIDHIPAIQPISSKYLRALASGYGYRSDPIYGTTKFHEGMDFSARPGTPVYATADGTVTAAKYDGAYGNMVTVSHGFNYVTRYAHLSKMEVKPGQSVKRGDLVGRVGATGKATGPHLHYEVRLKGEPQNPMNYYFFDITPEQYNELIQLADNSGRAMD